MIILWSSINLPEELLAKPITMGGKSPDTKYKSFKPTDKFFSFSGPGGRELLNNSFSGPGGHELLNNSSQNDNPPAANITTITAPNNNPPAANITTTTATTSPIHEYSAEEVFSAQVNENIRNSSGQPEYTCEAFVEKMAQELGPFNTNSYRELGESIKQRVALAAVNQNKIYGQPRVDFGSIGLTYNSEEGRMVREALYAGKSTRPANQMGKNIKSPNLFHRGFI